MSLMTRVIFSCDELVNLHKIKCKHRTAKNCLLHGLQRLLKAQRNVWFKKKQTRICAIWKAAFESLQRQFLYLSHTGEPLVRAWLKSTSQTMKQMLWAFRADCSAASTDSWDTTVSTGCKNATAGFCHSCRQSWKHRISLSHSLRWNSPKTTGNNPALLRSRLSDAKNRQIWTHVYVRLAACARAALPTVH